MRALCGPTDLRLGTVKAYLFAITRNLYRDSVAKRARTVATGSLPERYDLRPDPEVSAQGRQDLQNTLRVIQKLPEQQREAFASLGRGYALRDRQDLRLLRPCPEGTHPSRTHGSQAGLQERTFMQKRNPTSLRSALFTPVATRRRTAAGW
jgi:hypothetical protein